MLVVCAVASLLSLELVTAAMTANGAWWYVQDGGTWTGVPSMIRDRTYPTVTLPAERSEPYLLACYFWTDHPTVYGQVKGEWQGLDPCVRFSVAVADELDHLDFSGEERVISACTPIAGGGCYIGILIQPETGHTWADIPTGAFRLSIGAVECGGGSTGVGLFMNSNLMRSMAVSYVDSGTTDPVRDGSSAHPFRSLQESLIATIDGTVYIATGDYSEASTRAGYWNAQFTVEPGRNIQVVPIDGRPRIRLPFICRGWGGWGSSVRLERNDFLSSWIGSNDGGSVSMRDCTMSGLTYLYCSGGAFTLEDCTISHITLSAGRSLIFLRWGAQLTAANLLCAANALGTGAVIEMLDSTVTLTHATVTGNTTQGPLLLLNGSTVHLRNCVVFSNSTSGISGGGSVFASHSDLEWAAPGEGNISTDPLFVSPSLGDYHLQLLSPCVGAGSAEYATAADLDGVPRDSPPDMGAYEVPLVEIAPMADPPQGGSVSGGGSFVPGSAVQICAAPTPPYAFIGWFESGTRVEASTCMSFLADHDRELAALFAMLGNINADAVIDLTDARLCLQIALGLLDGTPAQRAAADVDGDGDVDQADARILAEYIIGVRTSLP